MPKNLHDLRQRITDAVQSITQEMFKIVWAELEYGLDIYRVTNGACIEHL